MTRPIIPLLSLLLLISTACNREEDDLITTPTATSTMVAGIIRTPDGTPLSNIPVTVDYKSASILGALVKHKAKGKTDKTGCYRIFFEISEEGVQGDISKSYTLSIDLKSLSSDKYLIPFSESRYEQFLYTKETEGRSLSCNLTVPRRKNIDVIIKNSGIPLETGEYAIRNTYLYGSSDLNPRQTEEPIKLYDYTPVALKSNGVTSLSVPCSIGIENKIELVYKGSMEGNTYYPLGMPASNLHQITVTDSYSENIILEYRKPDID